VFTPSQVADALQAVRRGEDLDYKGASGAVDFDPSGNVIAGFIVWRVGRNPSKAVEFQTVGRFTAEELAERIR
jgi:hypothetical protein